MATLAFAAHRFVCVLDNRNDVRGCDGLLVIAARAFYEGRSGGITLLGFSNDLDANPAFAAPTEDHI